MNIQKQLIIFLCCIFAVSQESVAQVFPNTLTDSTQIVIPDSTSITAVVSDSLPNKKPKKERFKLFKSVLDKTYPNPNRAAAFSLLLPGAGQIYNKKYWKLTIVYGALGSLGYVLHSSNQEYKELRSAYLAVVDPDSGLTNPFPSLNENSLLTLRDRANKRRQQGYIFLVAGWILNSVDAFVDAHLATFDVNEDISANVQPIGILSATGDSYGISVTFRPRADNNKTPKFIY